jgi:2-oxoglutarate/2-oxoacid ferredoxin oxidoreductase subunit alpha
VEKVADVIPPIEPVGDASGELLVLGWGGTYGSILTAVENLRRQGHSVSAAHLRYLNPMPRNLGEMLKRFKKILIPELNTGQLRFVIRSRFLVDAKGLNKVQGKPFLVEEIEQAALLLLKNQWGTSGEFVTPRKNKVTANSQNPVLADVPLTNPAEAEG